VSMASESRQHFESEDALGTSDLVPEARLPAMLGWVVAAAVVILLLTMSQHSLCVFANLTGTPCPGCGLTRAALALLRGDFAGATAIHPLIWICLPLLGALAGESALSVLYGRHVELIAPACRALGLRPDWLWSAACLSLVALWAARQLGAFGGPVPVNPLWTGLATWLGFR
jgi:hypothetical protein